MKIGDTTYKTSRPKDLDAQLVASTGLNAAEIAQQLAGTPMAHVVAAAARPFLGQSAPSVPEIASAIGGDGDGYQAALDQVRELYAEKVPAEPETTGKGGANG